MEHRKGDEHMSKWNTEKATCPNGTQKRWQVQMEHRKGDMFKWKTEKEGSHVC